MAASSGKKPALPPMTLPEVLQALEQAGTAQTRKTWARHGVTGPMFGVSFATLQQLRKRIRVDHALALGLWDTGNYDARNLAVKVADPARLGPDELDRWVREGGAAPMCGGYVAMLAAEGPHALAKVAAWSGSTDPHERRAGWGLVGQLAQLDTSLPDAWFEAQLARIEASIHAAPDRERYVMNNALIAIGGRSPDLRDAAVAAAGRIGKVLVDHGDTDCKTPDAAVSIAKAWAHSTSKGFASPAAHERTRERLRLRC